MTPLYWALPASSLDPRRADFDQRQAYFAVELKRTGVTKQILWEEYLREYPRGFAYLGGVPLRVKFDNLKPAITRPDRYEPRIAEALQSLALHYNTTIMAARPARPRDKASVENAVNKVYQRIFAPLRNHVFHSLAELNAAVRKL